MLLSTDRPDESGLQVSLREYVLDWAECRELEAGVPGVQIQSVHTGGHEDGL